MAITKPDTKNPGMMVFATFLALFVTNAVVVYAANFFFPDWVVLGTAAFSVGWAVFHSMLALALIGTFVLPFIRVYENKRGKMFETREWMVTYFLINFVAVWAIARLPEQFGLGISSWLVALFLALVLDFAQGAAMMQLEKLRPKLS